MVWLNIDIPTKKCTLHTDGNCFYWQQKRETDFKGLGNLKRDGGWLSFSGTKQAILYHERNYPDYQFKYCETTCKNSLK